MTNTNINILLFLVSCNLINTNWEFNHSKLEKYQGYLKSNDTINLSIVNNNKGQCGFLRSHDIQFTIGKDIFQEVVCHNERLGGNDEVSNFIFII